MKKTYDWNLRLYITVSNNQRKIEIVASAHTNVHLLKIEIAKILNISVLDSRIDLYFRDNKPMKPTSTLLQNEVTNGSHITASVERLKIEQKLPIQVNSKKQSNLGSQIQMIGLSVISSCTNEKCLNYNQDIEINYGYGTFAILQLTAFTKCQLCPYKSQFLRPSMLCKAVRVSKCLYKLKGTQLNNCGIPISKESGFVKTHKMKDIHTFIQKNPWNIGMQLIVKHL